MVGKVVVRGGDEGWCWAGADGNGQVLLGPLSTSGRRQ